MPTASIIIPSRGGAARLPRLLSALAAQTTDDWEAIVVIDGDIDGSEQVVARYEHLPIRSIVFPENRGRVAALNTGHESAAGDVLIRCDDDLEPSPEYVQRHVESHAHQEQGTIGTCINVLASNRYTAVYGHDADQLHQQSAENAEPQRSWNFWGGNVSLTRDLWNRVGPYDSRYRTYGWEDVDYGYRIHRAGVPVVIEPSLATPHHAAATTTLTRVRRAYHSGQARQLFDSIHGQGTSDEPIPEPDGLWNRMVLASARSLTYRRAELMAGCTDAFIHILPKPLARKCVALAVESAAVAGYREHTALRNDI